MLASEQQLSGALARSNTTEEVSQLKAELERLQAELELLKMQIEIEKARRELNDSGSGQ